jgi:S-adenosyl-L-methionine hydrolase (adenosine-forming)
MPAITLSTDIGQIDFITGAIKGQLIGAVPGCIPVDISHQLSPVNHQQNAYICKNAYAHFPKGSFHLILINFFEKVPSHVLFTELNQQYIICPDNGLITMIAGGRPASVYAISTNTNGKGTLLACTQAIAQAIQHVQSGGAIQDIASIAMQIEEKYPMRSSVGPDWVDSQIIFIDNFENVVLNITKTEFEEIRRNRGFRIELMHKKDYIDTISDNYSTVPPGESMAWFNSANHLEIAINKGNVAGFFGLKDFSKDATISQNRLSYQSIRIYFY